MLITYLMYKVYQCNIKTTKIPGNMSPVIGTPNIFGDENTIMFGKLTQVSTSHTKEKRDSQPHNLSYA